MDDNDIEDKAPAAPAVPDVPSAPPHHNIPLVMYTFYCMMDAEADRLRKGTLVLRKAADAMDPTMGDGARHKTLQEVRAATRLLSLYDDLLGKTDPNDWSTEENDKHVQFFLAECNCMWISVHRQRGAPCDEDHVFNSIVRVTMGMDTLRDLLRYE